MSILIIEIPPSKVLIDETLFPDKHKEEFVYEHLRHYCSKFYPIPTIEIAIYNNSVFVTAGHLYLKIARELGCPKIRAVIDKKSPTNSIVKLLNSPDITQLDWQSLIQDDDEPICYIWLVFFFIHALSKKEKFAFEDKILGFFSKINLPDWADASKKRIKNMKYINLDSGIEFQAYLPIEDERWYARSRAILMDFHFKYVPIISFQGRKFDPTYK
ncbi:hypothetical protein [Oscillatoria sp. HE19RPO]|uniref:hypothetical protein n=1 Tax=Oscillatoria sp. HE19RPO TaxID=2954806 RepID=UPI0020C2C3BF|nr:hypothetical protein [Oscillatoria sp. HE19RPO]